MKNFKKILSLMLSCSIAGLSAVSPSVSATGKSRNFPVQYDSIKSEESKDLNSGDKPFKVFEIYNAYYGITTTTTVKTTTKPTTTITTTSTTKTTKPTTSTTKTTKLTTSTTKLTTKVTTTKTTSVSATTTVPTTTVQTTFTTIETTSETSVQTTAETSETEITTTASTIPPFCNGIDVSQYQSNIDWQAVKDSGVDFVIIRAGYGKELHQVDPTFYSNIEGAQAVGIDVGIYWYSYADNSETARREAEVCYELIKDYSFEYPIYFDIEEPKHSNMSIAQTSVIVDTFCSEMENRGYYVGVYSYANFLQSHIYRSVLEKYDVWVAQYSDSLTAYNGHYGVWQYSSTGQVNGISGNVDMNYCYNDYSQIISANPDPDFIPPETTTAPKTLCDIVNADCTAVDWSANDKEIAMLAVNNSGEEPDFDMLAKNIADAKAESRKTGLIWYADKTTSEEMIEDAEKLHAFIEDYQLEYPIYLDLTNPAITESELTSDEISELIRAFCSVFDADEKHYIGVRGYDDFLTDRVNADIYEDYDVWLVTDDDKIRFGYKYGIISRLISQDDISYYESECLRNYPDIMITYHLNGF